MNCDKITHVYISGPITGNRNADSAFSKAEKLLSDIGYVVINPNSIPEPEMDLGKEKRWLYFMRNSIRMLSSADKVYMLDGWEDSRGAKLERHIAKVLGLGVMYESQITFDGAKDKNLYLNQVEDLDYINNALKLGWEFVSSKYGIVTLSYNGITATFSKGNSGCAENNGTGRLDD